jgi:acyl-CoA thioester hydrolase
MTAFLAQGGLTYVDMLAAGFDVQLVHTELDWQGSLRWGEPAFIDVGLARLGRTSFTLHFTARADERPVATGSTVYVVVATDSSGSRPIPSLIADALGPVQPLHT